MSASARRKIHRGTIWPRGPRCPSKSHRNALINLLHCISRTGYRLCRAPSQKNVPGTRDPFQSLLTRSDQLEYQGIVMTRTTFAALFALMAISCAGIVCRASPAAVPGRHTDHTANRAPAPRSRAANPANLGRLQLDQYLDGLAAQDEASSRRNGRRHSHARPGRGAPGQSSRADSLAHRRVAPAHAAPHQICRRNAGRWISHSQSDLREPAQLLRHCAALCS